MLSSLSCLDLAAQDPDRLIYSLADLDMMAEPSAFLLTKLTDPVIIFLLQVQSRFDARWPLVLFVL